MSTLLIRILALSSLAAFCTLCPTPSVRSAGADPPPSLTGYVQVWSDEFNGAVLDASKWGYLQGIRHDATNTPNALSFDGNNLIITTYTEGGTHYTGMIQSGGYCFENVAQPNTPWAKYMPRYGYIEAKMKLKESSGMWSSFWLQTPRNADQNPELEQVRGTEIDIVEHKAGYGDPLIDASSMAPSAVHFQGYPSCCYWMDPNCNVVDPTQSDGRIFWTGGADPPNDGHPGSTASLGDGLFHLYGLEWTPDYMKVYYDNNLVWTVLNSTAQHGSCDPSLAQGTPGSCYVGPCTGQTTKECVVSPVPHTPEYIVLNTDVVSAPPNYPYGKAPAFPDGYGPRGTGAGASTTKMTIDYVKHYQLLVAPTGLTATAQSTSEINLDWADNTYAEDGFKVERSINSGAFSQIATVGADVHTYLDTGLNESNRYSYRVRAYIGANYSPYSNTAIPDANPPAVITNLSFSDVKKTSVAVSWTAPGDDGTGQSVVEYDLRYSRNPINAGNFNSATRFGTLTPNVSGYPECLVINNLVKCAPYYFAIKSKDEYLNWSAISNLPSTTTLCSGNTGATCTPQSDNIAPANVTNLSVTTPGGTTTLAISWTAPGDDGATGTASEYDLRYSASPITTSNFGSATRLPIPAPNIAGTNESSVIANLLACACYYVALKTRDERNNWSGISNVPNGSTQCPPNQYAECGSGGAAKHPVTNDDSPRLISSPGPNPARGTTSFRISVPSPSLLRVGVFDIQGRQVRSLVNRIAAPGSAQIEWNLRDDSGHRVASGLYLVRVNLGDTRKTFRLMVVR